MHLKQFFIFQYQSIFFILPFLFHSIKSGCYGFQSRNQCLGTELPCCWIQYTFGGESVSQCVVNDGTDNYNSLKTNPDISNFSSQCAGQPVKDNCQVSSNPPTEAQCMSAKGDCCFLTQTTNVDYEGYDQDDFHTTEYDCQENIYGTEKAYENGFNKKYIEEIRVQGDEASTEQTRQIKAKCKTNTSSFYSLCMEQADQNSCLRAESNCCWIRAEIKNVQKGKHGASASNGYEEKICSFNQFTTASLAKAFTKSIIAHATTGLDTSQMDDEYDYTCSKHPYALYGGSGNVVKDPEVPTVTYDYDFDETSGEKPLTKALKDHSNIISFRYGYKVFLVLFIGLILF